MRRKLIVLHDTSGKPLGLDAQYVTYARRGDQTVVRETRPSRRVREVEVRETPKEIAKIIKDA